MKYPFHRRRQFLSILFCQGYRPAGQGVLISPGTLEEEGGRSWKSTFQFRLGVSGIISRPFVFTKHRGMAGIPESDSFYLTGSSHYFYHRNRIVVWPRKVIPCCQSSFTI